ncbi:hypothetical protein BE04_17155, partial [Sorangium cellulosum]
IDSLTGVLQIGRDKLDLDQPFLEMGVDSIMAVDIINQINKGLTVRLKTTDLFNLTTPRMLLDHLLANAEEPSNDAAAPPPNAPAREEPAAPPPAAGAAGDDELRDLLRRLGSGESVELGQLLELSKSNAQEETSQR